MSSRADGFGAPNDPDDRPTVLRPASSADEVPLHDVEDTRVRRPEATSTEPAPSSPWAPTSTPASDAAPATAPGFVDRVPWSRFVVPDHAPIQRFDQRPRFESLEEPADRTPASGAHASSTSAGVVQPGTMAAVPAAAPSSPPPTTSPASSRIRTPSLAGSGSPVPAGAGSPAPPDSPTSAPPPPGIDATGGPRRRGLLIPAIAFGGALLLLLGIGGGLTTLWLSGRDGTPAPAAGEGPAGDGPAGEGPLSEPGVWEPLETGQVPDGAPDDLRQVLSDNPLLEARLPVPAQCTLPDTDGGAVPADPLPGYLEAGADCLGTMWTDALDPVGIAFDAPDVVVFTMDALPTGSACATADVTESAPVVCHDDNTLYWPAAWDPGFSNTSAEETAPLYMWHLSYSYTMLALAATSLDGYYAALLLSLADSPEQADEAQRRYALQISCLSSSAAFQMPQGVRPAGRVEDFVVSVEAQAAPVTAGDPAPESRASWVATGRDSRGVLGECTTWSAPADQVA